MKRQLLSVIGSLVVAGALVGAQSSQPAAPQSPAPQPAAPQAPAPQPAAPQAPAPEPAQPAQPSQPADMPAQPSPSPQPSQSAQPSQDSPDDTTLKGCLVQGSGPNVFILDNAKSSTASETAKGERYVLEIAATPEQLKPVINTHVEVSGTAKKAEAAPSAAGQDAAESALPKLMAKRITRIAETCPAATGD